MKQLIITISDEFYQPFIDFFKHVPEVKIEEKIDSDIPAWQKEVFLEHMKNVKKEDVLTELDKKGFKENY